MPLFRKNRDKSQAERLAAWRLDSIPSRDFSAEMDALLSELGLGTERKRGVWIPSVGSGPLFLRWLDDDRVLAGFVALDDTHDPGELTDLLRRNLDPWLVWFALDDADTDSLGVRFKLPLDAFDRDAVLLGVETIAGLAGDDDVAGRARGLRATAAGEMEEQAAHARTREALAAGIEAAGLAATERDGVWEIAVERGVVQAIPRDTGESVLFMHELAYDYGTDRVEMLRWLLMASDWSGARIGLAPLPGGEGAFAAAAVAAADLRPQAVAWGVEQVLRVADEYDDKTGQA
jgi:hypothetical protein